MLRSIDALDDSVQELHLDIENGRLIVRDRKLRRARSCVGSLNCWGGGSAASAPRAKDDGYLSLVVFLRAGERMSASQRWEEESAAAGRILVVLEGLAP